LIAAENIADSTRKSIGVHLIIFLLSHLIKHIFTLNYDIHVNNLHAINANPLRAAMIVFLMMKDGE
jgi:hypothetical protein